MFSVDSSSFRSIEFKRRSKKGGIPRSFGGIAAHHAWWFMPCVDADGNQPAAGYQDFFPITHRIHGAGIYSNIKGVY